MDSHNDSSFFVSKICSEALIHKARMCSLLGEQAAVAMTMMCKAQEIVADGGFLTSPHFKEPFFQRGPANSHFVLIHLKCG